MVEKKSLRCFVYFLISYIISVLAKLLILFCWFIRGKKITVCRGRAERPAKRKAMSCLTDNSSDEEIVDKPPPPPRPQPDQQSKTTRFVYSRASGMIRTHHESRKGSLR